MSFLENTPEASFPGLGRVVEEGMWGEQSRCFLGPRSLTTLADYLGSGPQLPVNGILRPEGWWQTRYL